MLWLGCQAPPGRVEGSATSEAVVAEFEPVRVEPEPALAGVSGEDALLAEARGSIVGGRLSTDSRQRLAGSDQPDHRRATRLLQAVADEEPSPIVAPELVPEPAPEPEPEPIPEPSLELDAEATSEDDMRIDDLDPRRYPPDSAVAAWFDGSIPFDPPAAPVHDPLAGLLALDDPRVLLPIDVATAQPRVILTRLAITRLDTGALRLEIIGAGTVAMRVQALAAHRLRVRLDEAGAVPGFVSARPEQPELGVTAVRRGRGCVEVDLELASDWALVLGRSRSNGVELEFAPIPTAEPAG